VYLSDAPESSHWPAEVREAYKKVHEAMHKHPDPERARKEHQTQLYALRAEEDRLIAENNNLVRQQNALVSKTSPERAADRMKLLKNNMAKNSEYIPKYKAELAELKKTNPRATRQAQALADQIRRMEYDAERSAKIVKELESGAGVRTPADEKKIEELSQQIEDVRTPLNQTRASISDLRKMDPTASDYRKAAMALGAAYWGRPTEMFARAFESYVQDKLKSKGRANTYLVDGTTGHVPSGTVVPGGREAQPYPQAEERALINAAMDNFVKVLAETKQLEKAMRRLSSERFLLLGAN
jgi:hypothetical protein